MTWFTLNNLVVPALVYYYFGTIQLCLLLASAAISIIQYEIVNYIEHYGLSRKLSAKGVYEAVKPEHSWNAPQRITNYVMFKLQRHSDHHEHSRKSYQTLVSYESAP